MVALSYSQLQTYRTCPRQYEYAYKKKLSRQITAGESFGSSMHNTLKKWGELEMSAGGKRRTKNEQLVLFLDQEPAQPLPLDPGTLISLWHSSFIVEGYGTRVEADMARLRGERIMGLFFEWWSQEKREVFCVEKGFSLPINGQTVTGRFDRVEQVAEGLKVIDFKTSEVRSQEKVDADLQLSVYALACADSFGKPCTELSFLFLTEDGVTERKTERSPGQLSDAAKQMLAIRERMEGGDFRPTPGREVCRSCPYRSVCDVAAA